MNEVDPEDDTLLERPVARAPNTARPRMWRVVFYNDDYTTKWLVVHVLQHVFRMSEASATALMMAIHRQGKGVAGTYTRDVAETKAEEAMRCAREFGMPLLVTVELDSDDDGDK